VIKHGIAINGLAILDELPLLHENFRNHLIGGGRRSHPSPEVAASTEPKPFGFSDIADQWPLRHRWN
jgi:hypothetical protein